MNTATALLFFVLLSPLGSTTPARVALMVDAPQPINALEASITVPASVTVERIEDVGSVVSYWITSPRFDVHTRQLTFAGVIPSGYSGRQQVLVFDVASTSTGLLSIGSADAYLNGPDATPAPVAVRALSLSPPIPWWGQPWPYILLIVLLGALWLWRHVQVRFQ
jgi:hypothetical protein